MVAALAVLALGTGVAQAKTIVCGSTCTGTNNRDTLIGDKHDQTFVAKRGKDTIIGGGGNDTVYAGRGDDSVDVEDHKNGSKERDSIDCGPGFDRAEADSEDDTRNCERVD